MSEVQSRPSAPRGRGSSRGGRAGFGSRGGRIPRGHATNGDKTESIPSASFHDDSEVGQLKKQYGAKVGTIREMFPDWTDEDIVFALQETDGDLEITVERITDGSISQWGEVSKSKKDRSRSKVKDVVTTTIGDASNVSRASRGGRGGHDSSRGGRTRGTERGRGRGRGATGAHINGTRSKENTDLSIPTEESSVWESAKKQDETDAWDTSKPANDSWGAAATGVASTAAAAATSITSSIIPEGVKKSWASMFKPAPVIQKEPTSAEKLSEKPISHPVEPKPFEGEPELIPPTKGESEVPLSSENTTLVEASTFDDPDVTVTPSKDELTEKNVEQVLDTSNPAPSLTAASTAASSWDPRSGANSSTPYSALQQPQGAIHPPTSGFAASAMKATGTVGRVPSYQRRLLDQEEVVRMPGNREVDRAAVQFGAFSLGGAGDEDVDGDREEPETRAQPPQHSPVAHPRASLPPAPTQATGQPEDLLQGEEAGLNTAIHGSGAPGLPSTLPGVPSLSQQGSQGALQYNQYARYGQTGQQDLSSFGQKPYDPFTQQTSSSQSQYDSYPGQPSQSQSQSQPSAFSSAPNDYSQYYTADQQRTAYQNYYGQQYGQQGAQPQQDTATSQQRPFGSYNTPQQESSTTYPQASTQQTQTRYTAAGEGQASGHTTPNPPSQGQQQQPSQSQGHQSVPGPPAQPTGQYPYGHPYASNPSYYAAYMNQYQQGYGQGNYGGGPYGGKASMYSQPFQGYMSSQTPYDHTASPGVGGFSQSSLHGRESGLGAGLGEYNRAGSQPSQAAQPLGAASGFGGMQDSFSRSSYPGQGQQYGQQGGQLGSGDDLKPFGDTKPANGPSPSLSQAGRPGSATNSAPGQSTLPPPQSAQQAYSGYPGHLQQQNVLQGSQTGSQYGGLGAGIGGHQSTGQGHQSNQYGGYGQAFGTSYYGTNQQRGGWGNNYQH